MNIDFCHHVSKVLIQLCRQTICFDSFVLSQLFDIYHYLLLDKWSIESDYVLFCHSRFDGVKENLFGLLLDRLLAIPFFMKCQVCGNNVIPVFG